MKNVLLAAILMTGLSAQAGSPKVSPLIEQGRYLTLISACHDCHSPGFLPRSGDTDERSTWLTGDKVGWYSPNLGTTYPPNLRLLASSVDESTFMARARRDTLRPPMPWFQARAMKDADLRAIYHYIRSLGPAGEPSPMNLPPGPPPATPYFQFPKGPDQ
jgi:mono/diheme cytochrome c family protein